MTQHTTSTIFIIEDNKGDFVLLQNALEESRLPLKIVWFKEGADVLSYFEENRTGNNQALPDLIFLDYNLPCYNGVEMLNHFKKFRSLSRTPVVIMSTIEVEKQKKEVLSLGAVDFFEKPMDLEELIQITSSILNTYLKKNTVLG